MSVMCMSEAAPRSQRSKRVELAGAARARAFFARRDIQFSVACVVFGLAHVICSTLG